MIQQTRRIHTNTLVLANRIYKLLLFAYPAEFRREYGEPMAQLFRDETRATLRNSGAAGLVRFLLFTLVDLSKTILIEHLEAIANMTVDMNVDSYEDLIKGNAENAGQLEYVYKEALKSGEIEDFKHAVEEGYRLAPDNLLYAAWFHRLKNMPNYVKRTFTEWGWVVPLAVLNGLLFWLLADEERFQLEIGAIYSGITYDHTFPLFLLMAAPLAAVFVLSYFIAVSRKGWCFGAFIGFIMVAASAYVVLIYPQVGTHPFQEQYLALMAMHLPLLAWVGVGMFTTADLPNLANNRFSFLIKSLEVLIMGGLFVIAGGLLGSITIALFNALDINFPNVVTRLIFGGGSGLIPVVAAAVIYNPNLTPAEQAFDEGLSKLVALLMRILLPLTLLVLVVYLAFIPFNFWEPFENRDVLISYNVMLFAVIALLVGATPVSLADISPRVKTWLRRGIVAVAALALIVSIYALSAILYRTYLDRLTPNRLAFIGWNVINIGLLVLMLLLQQGSKRGQWLNRLFRAYSVGTTTYAVWTVAVIVAVPWLFGINKAEIETLPPAIQEIIYEHPSPILLKCYDSPHIYLLEDGNKRWIDTIETFENRGYVWNDVNFVDCATIDQIPFGVSIPANAGFPPD
jgi:hypothetical protein